MIIQSFERQTAGGFGLNREKRTILSSDFGFYFLLVVSQTSEELPHLI